MHVPDPIFAGALDNHQVVLLIFFVIAVAYLVMRITGRRFSELKRQTAAWRDEHKKKSESISGGAAGGSAAGQRRSAGRDLDGAIVELHDFAREVEGRLDTKITYLRKLLEEVESAERRLDAKVARASAIETTPAPTSGEKGNGAAVKKGASPTRSSGKTSSTCSDKTSKKKVSSKRAGANASASKGAKRKKSSTKARKSTKPPPDPITHDAPSADELAGLTRSDPPAGSETEDVRGRLVDVRVGETATPATETEAFKRVVALHDQGKEPDSIADELGLPKGEVLLMVGLHQSQKESSR